MLHKSKPKFRKRFGFTDREREILGVLAVNETTAKAAKVLGIKHSTLRSRLYRIRKRFDDAEDFVREYRRWRKKLPKRKYL